MCKRGDIYWAKLPTVEDSSIQQGFRPVLIIANQKAIKHSPVFQCIPITTKIKKNTLPVHVVIKTGGLYSDSMALVEQIGLIDKHRLREKVGTISEYEMSLVDKAVIRQLGMNEPVHVAC